MIAQAAIAALLTICTLAGWKVVTTLAGVNSEARQRGKAAGEVAHAIAAGEAAAVATPDLPQTM